MSRRGAREGTIRQRAGDGLWEARWVGADGRRRSLYAKSRKVAQERLRAALTAADSGIEPTRQRMTVGQWLDIWLTSVHERLRPRTAESYAMVARLYLKPAIGKIPLTNLRPDHVAQMIRNLSARGDLSSTTVRYTAVVLRISLGRAVKSGSVPRNVAALVDMPARARPEIAPLSAEQVRTFLASIRGERLEPLFVTAIATGLRQGELLGLRWDDVDFDQGTLAVRHTLQIRTRTLADPKTENARRTLRLGSEVISVLREHRHRQIAERFAAGPAWQDGDYVFTTSRGTPLDGGNLTHAFQAALARAGLPRQRFHDLRHATATLLLERGEELGVVSKVLGHSTVSTTLDVYGHLTAGMSQRVADQMDVIVRRPAAGS